MTARLHGLNSMPPCTWAPPAPPTPQISLVGTPEFSYQLNVLGGEHGAREGWGWGGVGVTGEGP